MIVSNSPETPKLRNFACATAFLVVANSYIPIAPCNSSQTCSNRYCTPGCSTVATRARSHPSRTPLHTTFLSYPSPCILAQCLLCLHIPLPRTASICTPRCCLLLLCLNVTAAKISVPYPRLRRTKHSRAHQATTTTTSAPRAVNATTLREQQRVQQEAQQREQQQHHRYHYYEYCTEQHHHDDDAAH